LLLGRRESRAEENAAQAPVRASATSVLIEVGIG
jgi:hypothetical protein